MRPETVLAFADESLADGTVCRRYEDGRCEWRRHEGHHASWRDSDGRTGVDELLGDGVIKRTHQDGRVEYGRDQGFGRTAWQGGQLLTLNRTSLGGRVGAAMAAIGAGALMGAISPPPLTLTPEEEAALRRKQADSGDGGGGSGGSDSGDGDLGEHGGGDEGDLGDDSDSDFG